MRCSGEIRELWEITILQLKESRIFWSHNSNQTEMHLILSESVLHMWRGHKSLFSPVQDVTDKFGILSYVKKNMNHEKFNVTINGISDTIGELPNDKSLGNCGLMSEHLNNAPYRFTVVSSVILQAMLKHRFLPKQILLTMIVLILKLKMKISLVNQTIVQ